MKLLRRLARGIVVRRELAVVNTTKSLLALLIVLGLGFEPEAAHAELLYVSMSDSTIVTYDVSGADAAAVSSTRTTFASGSPLSAPEEMVFDSVGNLYTTNRNGNTVTKITPAGVKSTFASGTASLLNKPIGLTIDPSGNLYVANENGATITKLTPAGVASTFATSVNSYGLTSDAAGNVYAAPGNTIVKFTPQGISSTFASTNLSTPRGMTFDRTGNLFVANFGDHSIAQFTTAGNGSVFANTGGVGPNDVAFDSLGNLYVAANGTRAIHKYNASGVFQFSWSTGGPRSQHLLMEPVAVPEPSTWAMAAGGLTCVGLGALRRRKPARSEPASVIPTRGEKVATTGLLPSAFAVQPFATPSPTASLRSPPRTSVSWRRWRRASRLSGLAVDFFPRGIACPPLVFATRDSLSESGNV